MPLAPYRQPKLPPKTMMNVEQGTFDFLVPYRKPTLLPKEAALCLGKSADFVRDLINLGTLESIPMSAKGESGREVFIVTRRSVLLYLVARANFDPVDFQLCLKSTLEALDASLLDFVIITATQLRAAKARQA